MSFCNKNGTNGTTITGLPSKGSNPTFEKRTFGLYCPKLKEWADDPANAELWDEIVEICNVKVSYKHFLEDWKYAFSLAIGHYICTMDPQYVQAIGADTVSGGVMSSRSVGNINYSYDVDKTIAENPAYKFWLQTGYGRQLVNLTLNRGWVGVLVVG